MRPDRPREHRNETEIYKYIYCMIRVHTAAHAHKKAQSLLAIPAEFVFKLGKKPGIGKCNMCFAFWAKVPFPNRIR